MNEKSRNDLSLMKIDSLIDIQNMIFTIRSKQVMIDHDIATYFGVETKRLNEQVKRNIDRFPDSFCFRLSLEEKFELVAKCDRLNKIKHSTVMPLVFTEQGVAMLTAVIKSSMAVSASLYIMNAFVNLRKFMLKNSHILERLGELEINQIKTENKLNNILIALNKVDLPPTQGIFFDGQVFDAFVFATDLVKSAKQTILLIDNYIDEQTLSILSKKALGVKVIIYTSKISDHLKLAVNRFNKQYPTLIVHKFIQSHDRFLIIDGKKYLSHRRFPQRSWQEMVCVHETGIGSSNHYQ